jgi:hypothetical protein
MQLLVMGIGLFKSLLVFAHTPSKHITAIKHRALFVMGYGFQLGRISLVT